MMRRGCIMTFVSNSYPVAVCLRTRNGNDRTSEFRRVASAVSGLKAKDAVLDMEAVVVDENGKTGFQALQAALGEGGRRDSVIAYVFDLLHLDGKDYPPEADGAERKASEAAGNIKTWTLAAF